MNISWISHCLKHLWDIYACMNPVTFGRIQLFSDIFDCCFRRVTPVTSFWLDMVTDLLTRRERANVGCLRHSADIGVGSSSLRGIRRPQSIKVTKRSPGLLGITVFLVPPWLYIIVFGYITRPKELVASEFYHFQHACEQNGKTITGREYWELHWRGRCNNSIAVEGIDSWGSLAWRHCAVPIFMYSQTCLFLLFWNYSLLNLSLPGQHTKASNVFCYIPENVTKTNCICCGMDYLYQYVSSSMYHTE